MPIKMNVNVLEAALEALESRKARIETEIATVRAMLRQGAPRTVTNGTATEQPRKRRQLSAAARERIANAQKKRWAEARKVKAQASAPMRARKAAKKKAAKKTAPRAQAVSATDAS